MADNPVIRKVGDLVKTYEDKTKNENFEIKENKSALSILTENTVENEEDLKTVKQTAFEEGMKQLFDKENLQMKTELSSPLILAMARGRIFASHYKSAVMDNFIDLIQVLSISKGRKGRQELVALVRNSQDIEEVNASGMTGIQKLMGSAR